MAQESIVKRGEKIISISSRQETIGNEELCLMAIEASRNHLVGEG